MMGTPSRAAVLPAPGAPFEIRHVTVDEPRDGELLVELAASGLCHTDLGVRFGGIPFPTPGIIGHEGVGVVRRVGAGVSDIHAGDTVVLSVTSCGTCDRCEAGRPAYCRNWYPLNIGMGARPDGSATVHEGDQPLGSHFFAQSSFSHVVIAERRNAVKVTSDLPVEMLAPLGCGVLTGVGAMWNVLEVGPEDRVAVFGTGAVGLSALMAAALRKPRALVAVDIVPERLDLARELGATVALDGRDPQLAEKLREATGGQGLDRVLDTTAQPQVARTALDALGPNGVVAVCGAPPPGTEIGVDIQGMLTGKTLVGLTMGAADPQVLIPELVRLVTDGSLSLDRLVRTFPLERIEDAVAAMHEGSCVKPVIVFG